MKKIEPRPPRKLASVRTIWKAGHGTLVVSIPKPIRDAFNIKGGELVEVTISRPFRNPSKIKRR